MPRGAEMKPEEIVRAACIASYNLDLDTYHKLKLPDGRWKSMQKDFIYWYTTLDSNNSRIFMEYALGGAGR